MSGTYDYLLTKKVEPLAEEIAACHEVKIVHLVPELARAKTEKHADRALSLSMLPQSIDAPPGGASGRAREGR